MSDKNAECARLMGWYSPDVMRTSWYRIPEGATTHIFYWDEPNPAPPPYCTDNALAGEVLDWFHENRGTHLLTLDCWGGAWFCVVDVIGEKPLETEAVTWQEAVVDARIAVGEV